MMQKHLVNILNHLMQSLDAFACFVLYLIFVSERNEFANFIIKMENLIELRKPVFNNILWILYFEFEN